MGLVGMIQLVNPERLVILKLNGRPDGDRLQYVASSKCPECRVEIVQNSTESDWIAITGMRVRLSKHIVVEHEQPQGPRV